MGNNISLTASMRSNLLSLQNISRQVSSTQNKLATGNKVNSAIDNPSSYYTARSLNNRANDLDALLDSMGQAVSTIKAATTALEAGATFLEQAAAVATSALETAKIPGKEWFASKDNVSAVVSNWSELKAALDSGKTGNIVIYGNITAEDTITLKAGQNLVGIGYYGVSEPDTDRFSQISFDLEKLGVTEGIKAQADNLLISDISIKAIMKDAGKIINLAGTNNQTIQNLDIMMDSQGLSDYNKTSCYGVWGGYDSDCHISVLGTNSIYETSKNEEIISSYALAGLAIDVYGNLNIQMQQFFSRGIANSTINSYDNSLINISSKWAIESTTANFANNSRVNINSEGESILYSDVKIDDNAQINISTGNRTVFYYSQNSHHEIEIASPNAKLNIQYGGSLFYNPQNSLSFNAVPGSQISANGKVYKANGAVNDNTMIGNTLPAGFVEVAGAVADPIPSLDWLKEQNANRSMGYDYKNETEESGKQYAGILNQYDSIIKDSTYKGVNLLKDEKLNVRFNENGSADLNVVGKDMSSNSLGLSTVEWSNQGDIAQSLQEIANALKSIRAFSAELGNNYSIITNRQEFTENLINILTEGADKLTLADMNEESANMLSLQTRQQLAINSLSLASQASQSILKLFNIAEVV